MTPRYQSAKATLYCADCRDILPILGRVSAIITDPPYGIGFSRYNSHEDSPKEHHDLMAFVEQARGLLEPGGWFFVWQAMKNADRWHEWFPKGYRIFAALKNFTQYMPSPIQFAWDPIIFWQETGKQGSPQTVRDYHLGNTAKWVNDHKGHPCPRPPDTARYLVDISTQESDIVLDPFMGSGTIGVAAVELGRRFVGIEIDPAYYAIAEAHIRQAEQDLGLFEQTAHVQNALFS